MKKMYLLIAAMFASVATQAAEVVGSIEAEVITASCVTKKEGLVSFLSSEPKYECKLWVESEYGQQSVHIKRDEPVKRGDKLSIMQTADGHYTVL
jgi:hypothetical protein